MDDYIDIPHEDIIRKIIGKNKIKYNTLTSLIDNNITNLKAFIINIDSVLLDLHKYFKQITDIKSYELTYAIASSILNIVAHYRYYFSLNGWYPNIYVLGDKSDNVSDIATALDIVRIILKYIPNSYYIDTTNLNTGIVIKYFLNKRHDNLILTRDNFDIMHLSKNTYVLRSNKKNSKLYMSDNWAHLLTENGFKEKYNLISYKLLNIILSIVGGHGRTGVKGLGFISIIKKISKAIESDRIVNDYYPNMHDFITDMDDLLNKYNLDNGLNNFNLYDINSNYLKCINKAVEKRLDNYIEDKFSKKDLMMLNHKYFSGLNYLMLEELMTKPKSFKNKHTNW